MKTNLIRPKTFLSSDKLSNSSWNFLFPHHEHCIGKESHRLFKGPLICSAAYTADTILNVEWSSTTEVSGRMPYWSLLNRQTFSNNHGLNFSLKRSKYPQNNLPHYKLFLFVKFKGKLPMHQHREKQMLKLSWRSRADSFAMCPCGLGDTSCKSK